MFATFHFGAVHQPLTWMTLGLGTFFGGRIPFGHHSTNLLLHIGNALLFYYVGVTLLFLV